MAIDTSIFRLLAQQAGNAERQRNRLFALSMGGIGQGLASTGQSVGDALIRLEEAENRNKETERAREFAAAQAQASRDFRQSLADQAQADREFVRRQPDFQAQPGALPMSPAPSMLPPGFQNQPPTIRPGMRMPFGSEVAEKERFDAQQRMRQQQLDLQRQAMEQKPGLAADRELQTLQAMLDRMDPNDPRRPALAARIVSIRRQRGGLPAQGPIGSTVSITDGADPQTRLDQPRTGVPAPPKRLPPVQEQAITRKLDKESRMDVPTGAGLAVRAVKEAAFNFADEDSFRRAIRERFRDSKFIRQYFPDVVERARAEHRSGSPADAWIKIRPGPGRSFEIDIVDQSGKVLNFGSGRDQFESFLKQRIGGEPLFVFDTKGGNTRVVDLSDLVGTLDDAFRGSGQLKRLPFGTNVPIRVRRPMSTLIKEDALLNEAMWDNITRRVWERSLRR